MISFAGTFAALRAELDSHLHDGMRSMLDRLERDERMISAWTTIARRQTPFHGLASTINAILETKAKSDASGEFQAIRSKLSDEYTALQSAANRLARYFEEFPASEIDHEIDHSYMLPPARELFHSDTPPSARVLNGQIRECKRVLRWTENFLGRVHKTTQEALEREFPATQKRESSQTAFAVMLCKRMSDMFGTPLYNFVATVTEVVYQTIEPVSPDAVRLAWKRDQKKRQQTVNRTIPAPTAH
jgi:hypothetical protein